MNRELAVTVEPEDGRETAVVGGIKGTLSPRQEAVAVSLATGATLPQAAKASGVGLRTIERWLKEQPALSRRVIELRTEMTARALGQMTEGMVYAAKTLRRLLYAKSETIRLGAARAVIELGVKLRESVEMEARLTALEGDEGDGGDQR